MLPPTYPQVPLRLIYHSALLLLLGFAAIVILRNIFAQRVVVPTTCWRGVRLSDRGRGVVQSLHVDRSLCPRSLQRGPGVRRGLDTWDGRIAVLNYVSLGSLTGVGSGVVVPVRPPATVLTTLEAVFGQFYIAVVVAQLVGARLSHAPPRNSLVPNLRAQLCSIPFTTALMVQAKK